MHGISTDAWAGWREPIEKLEKRISRREARSPVGERRRELDRSLERLRRNESTLDRLRQWNTALFRGEPGVQLSKDMVDDLINSVCRNVTGYVMRDAHRFVILGLEKGIRELGWQLELPPPFTINITEPSSFSPEVGVRLSQFDALESAFWKSLAIPVPVLDRLAMDFEAGRLLYSLVAHTGVVNLKLLDRVPAAIQAGAGVYGDIVWLDVDDGGDGGNETTTSSRAPQLQRRIFPAPVTQILLQRWYENWGAKWPIPTEHCAEKDRHFTRLLKPYVQQLCIEERLPEGIAQSVQSVAQADLITKLPTSVFHFLRSRHLGKSVPLENWCRLLTGEQGVVQTVYEREVQLSQEQPFSVQPQDHFPDQHVLLKRMNKAIRSIKRKAIPGWLEGFIEQDGVSPILQLMTHWAIHKLRYGGAKKEKLPANTVARYLNYISPLLDYADVFTDPFLPDEDSWQEVYDEILARSHGVSSNRISWLSDFHHFLERTYGVPVVDIGGVGSTAQVDARILTPLEYYRVRDALQKQARTERWAPIQELVTIFGYRCGLRRSEALARLFADFAGIDDPILDDIQLLVRHNKNSTVKSEAGTRTLPLHVLLTDEELGLLKRFCADRRQLISGEPGRRSLFAEEAGGFRAMPQAQIFDPLTRLLKEVTGDNTFRFHHLRHSFVSLTFLRLIETKPGEHIPDAWRLDEEGNHLLPSMNAPLWEQIKLSGPGQALWNLGMWAGHASPSISLQSYSHLLDWLARSYLWRCNNATLSIQEQALLLGKSKAAAEKLRQRKKMSGDERLVSQLADKLAKEWPSAGLRPLPKLGRYEPAQLPDDGEQIARPKIMYRDAYELMLAMETIVPIGGGEKAPRGLRAAADLRGLEHETAVRWHDNAVYAMSLRTNRERNVLDPSPAPPESNRTRFSREHKDVRRSLEEKDHKKGDVELQTFISPPHTPETKKFAKRYFDRLMEWHETDPELVVKILKIVIKKVQRSKSRISFTLGSDQILFYKMLCQLHLKSRVTIKVNITKEMLEKKNEIIDYWSARFDTSPDYIKLIVVTQGERFGLFGKSDVDVNYPPELYKKQNLFWFVIRFVTLSAYVVSAERPEANEELQNNE